MKLEKQKMVLEILATGFYEVDYDNALVYSIRKRGRSLLKTNMLPSRYQQIFLFKGRHTGVKIIVYLHQLVYLSRHGLFDPALEIDHEDRDRSNNKGPNLVVKTPTANKRNSERTYYPKINPIRSEQIKDIKLYHGLGESQAGIAKLLGLNRLSVRYVIKRIEAGLPLKYE